MTATNLGTGNFSIKNHLNYQKKQKLAYPETLQQHGRQLLRYKSFEINKREGGLIRGNTVFMSITKSCLN